MISLKKFRIGRVSSYPTDIFNKVGFQPFVISNSKNYITYYASPKIDGVPLVSSKNLILKRFGEIGYKKFFNYNFLKFSES